MTYILSVILALVSHLSFAEVLNSSHVIKEVQVRTNDYYSAEWSNGVTLLLEPEISMSDCNAYRAFFLSVGNEAMLSVALSAHAQGKTVNLLLNPSKAKDTICKIELISIQ